MGYTNLHVCEYTQMYMYVNSEDTGKSVDPCSLVRNVIFAQFKDRRNLSGKETIFWPCWMPTHALHTVKFLNIRTALKLT